MESANATGSRRTSKRNASQTTKPKQKSSVTSTASNPMGKQRTVVEIMAQPSTSNTMPNIMSVLIQNGKMLVPLIEPLRLVYAIENEEMVQPTNIATAQVENAVISNEFQSPGFSPHVPFFIKRQEERNVSAEISTRSSCNNIWQRRYFGESSFDVKSQIIHTVNLFTNFIEMRHANTENCRKTNILPRKIADSSCSKKNATKCCWIL